jgi:alginate O-acetyltransferase complex protein AlgI
MSFTSFGFILFLVVAVLIFYLFPFKKRWWVLLVASYAFYVLTSWKALIYLSVTTAVTFIIAYRMQHIQDECDAEIISVENKAVRKELKAQYKHGKKHVLVVGIVFVFGVLAVLKYSNFVLFNFTPLIRLFSKEYAFNPIKYFVPMGISFYTFSVTSYLFDIYNNKYKAEQNPFRYALYVSWFPALVQGPINRNNQLRHELFEKEHVFDLKQTQFGLQRILWGFLKKLVIANRAAQVVSYIFGNYKNLPNFIILFGLLFYSIQLYADFAGGMDVAIGVSELFGVKISENFRQPYFSQSIAEFWRRWHITLGAWMKDYIFYPFALSKTSLTMGKKLGERNRYLGRVIPMCIGNLLVFLLVGIWHGAEWHFVLYGLFHGGIIAFSILMDPVYQKQIVFFHINTETKGWKIFRIVRTFYLVNLGCLLDDVTNLHQSWGMTKQLFDFTNGNLIKNFHCEDFGLKSICIILFFCALWFMVSIHEEKGTDERERIAAMPIALRWFLYLALIFATPLFQASFSSGFMYAQF